MIIDGDSRNRGNGEDNGGDRGEETSSSEEASSTGIHSEDSQALMEYGSEDSQLSQLLDEELNRVKKEGGKDLEKMDISLPSGSWNDMMDNDLEEETDLGMNVELDGDGDGECNINVEKDDEDDEDEICDGFQFLQHLDPDFICSPRMIVRGVYTGEVLKLEVKRKTEGNLVHWKLFDTKRKKQLLSVKAQMEYRFELSTKAQGTSEGVKVLGGWKWRGWGYGYSNIFPPSDPRVLHVDIQEALFYGEEVNQHYHVSGRNCKNLEKSEDIVCREEGCGLRIHSVMFTTFSTVEEELPFYELGKSNVSKEREESTVYFSLVAFFNGEMKIALHREGRLKKYQEEVAWLTKDEQAHFDDSLAGVDRVKIEKAKQIWETVPKTAVNSSLPKVIIL